MVTTNELDIITRMRGEVMSRKDLTGENLFLAWVYPTVIPQDSQFLGRFSALNLFCSSSMNIL